MSGSKWLAIAVMMFAACELEPPPNKHAAPAPSPSPSPSPSPNAGSGAGSAAADITDACMQAGVHFADVWINEAENAQDKAALEQERTLLVRRTGVACTQGAWSEQARACVETAKTRAEIAACEKQILAGSAAGSNAARQR